VVLWSGAAAKTSGAFSTLFGIAIGFGVGVVMLALCAFCVSESGYYSQFGEVQPFRLCIICGFLNANVIAFPNGYAVALDCSSIVTFMMRWPNYQELERTGGACALSALHRGAWSVSKTAREGSAGFDAVLRLAFLCGIFLP